MNRSRKIPLSCLCAALMTGLVQFAAAANGAATGNFDVMRLMQLRNLAPEAEVAYTERKYSSLLAEPVVSSGTLAWRRPDTVEKNMVKPRAEQLRMVGNELVMVRNGAERRISIASQPLLGAFAASLRGILAGDGALLREHFRLDLTGDEQAWRLALVPLDVELLRYVERIVVTGRAGRIEQIEVNEGSGDRSVLQIR